MANTQITRQRALIAVGFTPYVRRIRIGAAPDGSQQLSGFTLPSRSVVIGAWINVLVAEVTGTTKTVDVGRESDPDGYLDGVDVSAVGVKNATVGALLPTTGAGDAVGGGEVATFTSGSADFVELRADIYLMYLNLSDK
jgi:hypothetical protein